MYATPGTSCNKRDVPFLPPIVILPFGPLVGDDALPGKVREAFRRGGGSDADCVECAPGQE